ncbi:MAG TPA: dihydrolipoyl dehydrogenase [Roseiarcus sp.]|nr:dihydrolipoyl dehydrogenase [Roseiarcus sp.]
MRFDLIVIGSGPGGYVAAIRAAQLGFKTAVVEREHLGGICLNWGCIPTKALLRSAEVYDLLRHAASFGLAADNVRFDAQAVVQRSRDVSQRLNRGVAGLLKKNGVCVIWGEAELTAPGRVQVTAPRPGRRPAPAQPAAALGPGDYSADHIIIATGARPRTLPGLEPGGSDVWSYFEAMMPERVPESLLVVGSGAIGIEFASFYRLMGAKVTVVEVLEQILPNEDAEIALAARKQFEQRGIAFHTSARVAGISARDGQRQATIARDRGAEEIAAEKIIVAVGVQGNIETLGLENLGIRCERGCIVADAYGRTNVAGLYAIGDVAGPPMLAHKAEHEGVVCVESIAGLKPQALDRNRIPGCTYSSPQIASVGLTEASARAAGRQLRVGRFPFAGNGKAIALGEGQGMVKTLFDASTGALLGAHLVGPEVTELVQGFVLAMGLETTEEELLRTVFPHPTLSEAMHESVLAAYGRAIHS